MASSKEEVDATAPDPDEDELDDLDDVLDKFDAKLAVSSQTKSTPSSSAAPNASGPGRPVAEKAAVPGDGTEDFESQLQAGMADLITQLGDHPAMQKQFETMMQELIAAGAAGTDEQAAEHIKHAAAAMPDSSDDTRAATSATTAKKEDSFQDTIRKTMERMQQSGDAATAASASAGAGAGAGGMGGMSEEELMAQIMGLAGGEGGEEGFNEMLLNMMTQLTNKEILYDPMKELDDKFPAWLEKNGPTTSPEDLKRYQEQAKLTSEIVKRFERSGYSDDNDDDREYIVERMQKMQAAGSPPSDLVGDMNAAQEALGEIDAGCPTQ